MRVLILNPPVSIARDFIDYPYFMNLGAAQLAAVVREHHDVDLVDAFAMPRSGLRWRPDGRAHLGAPVEDVLGACTGADAIVVTYSPFQRPPHRDELLGQVLAGLRGRIILADAYQSGQHYVEASGGDVLAAYPEVGTWLKYEAERTLPSLLHSTERGRSVVWGQRPACLDALPFPAWDLVDLDAYDGFRARVVRELGRGHWAFPIDGRTLPLVTSRGCPFTCTHCSSNPDLHGGEPKTQRRYSAARLYDYMRELTTVHGATRLEALDELLNVSERHFDSFLEAAADLDVTFDIPNGLRADYLERRHFARMHGRVTTVSVSAESGSQRVVSDVVRKRLDLARITEAADNAHRAGVGLMIHYMIGLPGESAEEINETLEFALDLWDRFAAWPAVQFATPLPGTQLARGRSLPVVDDWGPRFQQDPSALGSVTSDELGRFKDTFDARLQASTGPQKLIVNVTYVCNNHCTFCAVGTRTQIDGHPTRQREILARYRRQGVEHVDFDGGEPTLNPELIPLIRYAKAIGYRTINVTTNGRRCAYPEYAENLMRSGVTTTLFSIHGADARTHAQQVGVAEAFEQSTDGIRHCVASKPDHVELGLNITLTKGNVSQLDEVAQLTLDLGLRWLNVQFLTPFGRATAMVAPDTQHAADLTMQVIDRYHPELKIQVINLPYCYMPGYERHLEGDRLKLSRHMAFVNNETVNLADYLSERRTRKPVCKTCPHACFCSGFYELKKVPEPPWLVSTDDLLRRIEP